MDIAQVVNEYGFPIVMIIGLGYFIYFIWHYIAEHIEPELAQAHKALIKVIDQIRMLDQDIIRLQQKVTTILEYRDKQDSDKKHK